MHQSSCELESKALATCIVQALELLAAQKRWHIDGNFIITCSGTRAVLASFLDTLRPSHHSLSLAAD